MNLLSLIIPLTRSFSMFSWSLSLTYSNPHTEQSSFCRLAWYIWWWKFILKIQGNLKQPVFYCISCSMIRQNKAWLSFSWTCSDLLILISNQKGLYKSSFFRNSYLFICYILFICCLNMKLRYMQLHQIAIMLLWHVFDRNFTLQFVHTCLGRNDAPHVYTTYKHRLEQ